MSIDTAFLRLKLDKCCELGSQRTRLWGEICTQSVCWRVLVVTVSWGGREAIELRNTHSRGFMQSTRNLRACVALWIVLSWSKVLDVYISSPTPHHGLLQGRGRELSGGDAFGPRAVNCQLSILPGPGGLNTSVMKHVSHTIHHNYLYLKTPV